MNARSSCIHSPHVTRLMILIACLVAGLCGMGCESSPTISIDVSNPPTFVFSGEGHLDFFVLREIAPENQNVPNVEQDTDKNKVLWRISPKTSSGGDIQNLPPITYGKVPVDFIQETPPEGGPIPLIEGKVYEAGGPAIVMPQGYLRFTIRQGKVVQIPIPRRQ